MKLINKTGLSDKVLEDILRDAAKALNKRVRTIGVVVKVVYNKQSTYTNGWAKRCDIIEWGNKNKWIKTDKGVFQISVPNLKECFWICYKPIDVEREYLNHQATKFFETARHEWGHIADFQSKEKLQFDKGLNGRRRNHGNRLEERRVHEYIERAKERGHTKEKYMESITNFAKEVLKKYGKDLKI